MKPLQIGDSAPDFVVDPTDNSTLHGLIRTNQIAAIVYFYPMDFSPVCSAQACMFRDLHNSADDDDQPLIIGVSPQSDSVHAKFRKSMNLPQLLVADRDKSIARSYGALGLFRLVRRVSYVISTDNRILDMAIGTISLAKHQDLVNRVVDEQWE
ncbi:MAG: thioredoxin-dependent thiol peroxidase [Phycisphaerales bacterium]